MPPLLPLRLPGPPFEEVPQANRVRLDLSGVRYVIVEGGRRSEGAERRRRRCERGIGRAGDLKLNLGLMDFALSVFEDSTLNFSTQSLWTPERSILENTIHLYTRKDFVSREWG